MKYVSLVCGIWFALMSGFFFAFSSAVMPGLASADGPVGLQAMQAINGAVANPLFAAGFWVALLLATGGGIFAVVTRQQGWPLLLGACLVYVLGAFLTTAAGNVPLNRALEQVTANTPDVWAQWQAWQANWTRLNHVRMIAAFAAAAMALSNLLRAEH